MYKWLKVFDTKQKCSFYWENDETLTKYMEQLNSVMTKRFFACYAPYCSMDKMTYRIHLEQVWQRGAVSVLSVKLQQIFFAKTSQTVCSVDNWCYHWYRHLKQVVLSTPNLNQQPTTAYRESRNDFCIWRVGYTSFKAMFGSNFYFH